MKFEEAWDYYELGHTIVSPSGIKYNPQSPNVESHRIHLNDIRSNGWQVQQNRCALLQELRYWIDRTRIALTPNGLKGRPTWDMEMIKVRDLADELLKLEWNRKRDE